jgi:hypothetical protein
MVGERATTAFAFDLPVELATDERLLHPGEFDSVRLSADT